MYNNLVCGSGLVDLAREPKLLKLLTTKRFLVKMADSISLTN